jgi:hypothetical protein
VEIEPLPPESAADELKRLIDENGHLRSRIQAAQLRIPLARLRGSLTESLKWGDEVVQYLRRVAGMDPQTIFPTHGLTIKGIEEMEGQLRQVVAILQGKGWQVSPWSDGQ